MNGAATLPPRPIRGFSLHESASGAFAAAIHLLFCRIGQQRFRRAQHTDFFAESVSNAFHATARILLSLRCRMNRRSASSAAPNTRAFCRIAQRLFLHPARRTHASRCPPSRQARASASCSSRLCSVLLLRYAMIVPCNSMQQARNGQWSCDSLGQNRSGARQLSSAMLPCVARTMS